MIAATTDYKILMELSDSSQANFVYYSIATDSIGIFRQLYLKEYFADGIEKILPVKNCYIFEYDEEAEFIRFKRDLKKVAKRNGLVYLGEF